MIRYGQPLNVVSFDLIGQAGDSKRALKVQSLSLLHMFLYWYNIVTIGVKSAARSKCEIQQIVL